MDSIKRGRTVLQTSAHDGSLNPIRNDLARLERQLTKERNKRKNLQSDLFELQEQVRALMEFHDGDVKFDGRKFVMTPIKQKEEDIDDS